MRSEARRTIGRPILAGIACLLALLMVGASCPGPSPAPVGLVDQQHLAGPSGPGTNCGKEPGHLVQSVTPGACQWETVRLLINRGNATGDVTLHIRAEAPDGPVLATATASLPSTEPKEMFWATFTFAPPVRVTPGEQVFLDLEVRDFIGVKHTLSDPYPGGTQWAKCAHHRHFQLSDRADQAFSTHIPAPCTCR